MSVAVALSPTPILQFFNNSGQPNAGGSILTQVGGINYPTYQDAAGTIPLPNPIPLNSRGEISNSSGQSCQIFLESAVNYIFIQYDSLGNQINEAPYMAPSGLNYTAPFTGAVTRTVAAKLQESVSVLDFGADPTGETDSTVAFNDALTYAASAGIGKVTAPSGNYKTTGPINRPAGVILSGAGSQNTNINATGNYSVISAIGSVSNVINGGGVEGICLNGTWGGNSANTSSWGIQEAWTNRSVKRDVRIHGCYIGVYEIAVWQNVWDNIQVDGAGTQQNYDGFYLDQLPTTFPAGISNAVIATNCVAQGVANCGYRLFNPNGSKFSNCEAENGVYGWLIGNTAAGMYPIEFGNFVNCLADTCSADGWVVQQGSNGSPVQRMQFSNCWCGTAGTNGVYADGCQGINFSNFQVANCGQGGIVLNNSAQCVVNSCELSGNNTSSTSGVGDITVSGGSYNVITSNLSNSPLAAFSILETNATDNNMIGWNMPIQKIAIIGANTVVGANKNYFASTGWGTPTGGSGVSNFSGSSATLIQTSTAVSEIISVLLLAGLLGQ